MDFQPTDITYPASLDPVHYPQALPDEPQDVFQFVSTETVQSDEYTADRQEEKFILCCLLSIIVAPPKPF
jgi:hypothetical protein